MSLTKGILAISWAKFTALVASGGLEANKQYLIVDENIYPDTKFKGVFSGDSYELALDSLESAYPTATSGDWAILNAPNLPPIYAIWDADETPEKWVMSGQVAIISVEDTDTIKLNLIGNVLSADLKNEAQYSKYRGYISDWQDVEALMGDGLGYYNFDGSTLNLPTEFSAIDGVSMLLAVGRADENFVGIAIVRFTAKYRMFLLFGEDPFRIREMFADQNDLLNYIPKTDIEDNLNSTDATKPLSANQGKVLKDLHDDIVDGTITVKKSEQDKDGNAIDTTYVKISNIVDNLTTDDATKVLSAKQGKALQDGKVDKITTTGTGTRAYGYNNTGDQVSFFVGDGFTVINGEIAKRDNQGFVRPKSGNTASRPTTGLGNGASYYNTDTKQLEVYIGDVNHWLNQVYKNGDTLPTPASGTSHTYMVIGNGNADDDGNRFIRLDGTDIYESDDDTMNGSIITISNVGGVINVHNVAGAHIYPITSLVVGDLNDTLALKRVG